MLWKRKSGFEPGISRLVRQVYWRYMLYVLVILLFFSGLGLIVATGTYRELLSLRHEDLGYSWLGYLAGLVCMAVGPLFAWLVDCRRPSS